MNLCRLGLLSFDVDVHVDVHVKADRGIEVDAVVPCVVDVEEVGVQEG